MICVRTRVPRTRRPTYYEDPRAADHPRRLEPRSRGAPLCVEALGLAGNIVGAAQLLGITRHALKRRIIKLEIRRSRDGEAEPEPSE
jgi:hypothetical protein